MANFFEHLSDEDKKKVESWGREAQNPRFPVEIPPTIMIAGQLGVLFGWGAVEAFIRGTLYVTDDDGTVKTTPFTIDYAVALCKAAQKASYIETERRGKARNINGQ